MPWSVDCISADSTESFPCCDGQGNGSFIFNGLKITDGQGASTYIFSPFEVALNFSGETAYISDYKGNGITVALADTDFNDFAELVAALAECIDCDCGDPVPTTGLCLYRQAWINHNDNSVTVTANGGFLPSNPDYIEVYFNGRLMLYEYDYEISGSNINFLFDVVQSVIQVIFFVPCSVCFEIFREQWIHHNTNSVTVTVNGGTMPDSNDEVLVYFNGRLMKEGNDYNISGNVINFLFDVVDSVIQVVLYV